MQQGWNTSIKIQNNAEFLGNVHEDQDSIL